jgi:hypothetical protein
MFRISLKVSRLLRPIRAKKLLASWEPYTRKESILRRIMTWLLLIWREVSKRTLLYAPITWLDYWSMGNNPVKLMPNIKGSHMNRRLFNCWKMLVRWDLLKLVVI